jgi:hypothetical protein
MSLAFALRAAINGSTGSSARLSFGLNGTKPHRRQSDGVRILTAQRRRRKPSETLSCESRTTWARACQNPRNGPTFLSRSTRSHPLRGSVNGPGRGPGCANTILIPERWPAGRPGTLVA